MTASRCSLPGRERRINICGKSTDWSATTRVPSRVTQHCETGGTMPSTTWCDSPAPRSQTSLSLQQIRPSHVTDAPASGRTVWLPSAKSKGTDAKTIKSTFIVSSVPFNDAGVRQGGCSERTKSGETTMKGLLFPTISPVTRRRSWPSGRTPGQRTESGCAPLRRCAACWRRWCRARR